MPPTQTHQEPPKSYRRYADSATPAGDVWCVGPRTAQSLQRPTKAMPTRLIGATNDYLCMVN